MTIAKMPISIDKLATLNNTDSKHKMSLTNDVRTNSLETQIVNISIARIPILLTANIPGNNISSKTGW